MGVPFFPYLNFTLLISHVIINLRVYYAKSSNFALFFCRGSLDGEVSTITGDALDAWLSTDSKWRRSPEGGEDVRSRGSHSSKGSRDGDIDLTSEDKNSIIMSSEKKKKTKKDKDQEKVSTCVHSVPLSIFSNSFSHPVSSLF